MRHYEVTFIVDPLLSSDEIKGAAHNYIEHLEKEGSKIIDKHEMGLRQLAYPIKKRNSGIYFSIEFACEFGQLIPKLELALSRDGRILRFLTCTLDKHGIKFNEDRRNGLIGNRKEEDDKAKAEAEKAKAEKTKTETPPAKTVKATSDKEPEPTKKIKESE